MTVTERGSVFVRLSESAPLCMLRHRGARLRRSFAPPSVSSLPLSVPLLCLSLSVCHGRMEQWEWMVLPFFRFCVHLLSKDPEKDRHINER